MNCGDGGVSEIAKTSLIDISLVCSIGELYGFWGPRGTTEVFRAKIRFQHAVWMPSGQIDALFRLKTFS